MGLNVTSFSSNGLRDWLIQRLSAIVMAVYSIFLFLFFVTHAPVDYAAWVEFFSHRAVKIFSLLFLLSLLAHAWIGMWTVFTDYVKITWIRLTLYSIVALALLSFLGWGIAILWSV
jgi:succinate dehydrogenase / fumarate reductase membrane anchor subunit